MAQRLWLKQPTSLSSYRLPSSDDRSSRGYRFKAFDKIRNVRLVDLCLSDPRWLGEIEYIDLHIVYLDMGGTFGAQSQVD